MRSTLAKIKTIQRIKSAQVALTQTLTTMQPMFSPRKLKQRVLPPLAILLGKEREKCGHLAKKHGAIWRGDICTWLETSARNWSAKPLLLMVSLCANWASLAPNTFDRLTLPRQQRYPAVKQKQFKSSTLPHFTKLETNQQSICARPPALTS